MYFNNSNNFFHGIVFHHFHNEGIHTKGQGSISKDDFYKIINFIGKNNILGADTFYEKFKNNKLKENEVCLTFDDAIKCQIDIALPVLEDLKIKSFFFVYSSVFDGKPNNLEVFRYFRMNHFDHVDEFYKNFYKILDKDLENFFNKKKELILEQKKRYDFYSYEDIKFRLVRDYFLTKDEYENHMFNLIKKKIDIDNIYSKLFINKEDLILLDNLGHTIGLHSHTHPTLIEKLSYKDQKAEYSTNLRILLEILNKNSNYIKSCSHPAGSYDKNTLKILKELGIEVAFKDSMKIEKEKGMKKINNSSLEIAREDHVKILKRLD